VPMNRFFATTLAAMGMGIVLLRWGGRCLRR
jgi:hypothetical protein